MSNKVLLIEDCASNREMLVDLLGMRGFNQIDEAESIVQAIVFWTNELTGYKFVIADDHIADGSTAQGLIQKFKQEKPQVVIIGMTGNSQKEMKLAGCDEVLRKPYEIAFFVNLLTRLNLRP